MIAKQNSKAEIKDLSSSLSSLLRIESLKQELNNYAKLRNFSLEEVREVLSKAVNLTFKESGAEELKKLSATYTNKNFLIVKDDQDKIIDLGKFDLGENFNHIKFHLEKSITYSFKVFQFEKLKSALNFENKLYEIEIVRTNKNFIIGELTDFFQGVEVWIDSLNMIKLDRIKTGDKILVVLMKPLSGRNIRTEPRYLGTRRGEEFILLLLNKFVPEIEEGSVIIEKILREEGVKTYLVVRSSTMFVNASRSIIGPGGNRIKEIKKNIPERIEVIEFRNSPEEFLEEILKDNLLKIENQSNNNFEVWVRDIESRSYPHLENKLMEEIFPEIKIKWLKKKLEQQES